MSAEPPSRHRWGHACSRVRLMQWFSALASLALEDGSCLSPSPECSIHPGIQDPSHLLNKDPQLVLVLGLETLVSGLVSVDSPRLGQGSA